MGTATKHDVLTKIGELLVQHEAQVRETAEKLLRTGAVDVADYEDDYRLPKIILTAALADCSTMYRPLHDEDRQTVNNLRNF